MRRNEGNIMSKNLNVTNNQEEPTYITDGTPTSNKLLELMDAGFSTEQIKLLMPFLDKISTLDSDGLSLLKSRLDEGGFSSQDNSTYKEENTQLETHQDSQPETLEKTTDSDTNHSEISLLDDDALQEEKSEYFGHLVEFSVSQSFEDISRHLAKTVALAVSKEVNMHILSVKAEQDLRITALENALLEQKSIPNTKNKSAFPRNSKKNRSTSTCVPLTTFKTS